MEQIASYLTYVPFSDRGEKICALGKLLLCLDGVLFGGDFPEPLSTSNASHRFTRSLYRCSK